MKKYLVFIIAAILIASCGTRPTEETDWCYIYNFRTSNNGFNIANGQWIDGVGFRSVAGVLSFSYEYDGDFVTPGLVYVNVKRPDGIVGNIPINAAGTIYGVSAAFSATMTTNEETVHFTPETYGDAGTTINVTIDAFSQELIVQWISVEGFDPSPFPRNDCEDQDPYATASATVTAPVTYTPTPTMTPSYTEIPTETPTVSDTPTPSPTPECQTLSYDFKVTQGGFASAEDSNAVQGGGNAQYYTNSGWGRNLSGNHPHVVIMRKDMGQTVTITNVTMTVNQQPDNVLAINTWSTTTTQVSNHQQSSPAGTYITTGTIADSARYVRLYVNNDPDGMTPYASYGTGRIIAATISYCFGAVTPTPSPTPTGETPTPIVPPTATPFNFRPTVDLTQTTATPSVSPTITNTSFPVSTPYATAIVEAGTPTYSVQEIRENEAEWQILQEEQRGNNAQENLLQDILEAVQNQNTGTSNTSGSGSGSGGIGSGVGDGASDITAGVGATLGDASDVFGTSGNYLGDALSGLNGLLTSFYTTPAQPFPGLPQCMTHPLEHDICAIYYVLDWTLFAPNTMGQFIIPVLQAIMSVIFIFKIVGYVLRLVGKTEDITR